MVKIKLKTLANKTYDMELDADLNVRPDRSRAPTRN